MITAKRTRFWTRVHLAASWDGLWWMAVMVVVLIVSICVCWRYWEALHSPEDSLSTTIRNLGLVIGGVEALLLALWRSRVAGQQAHTAQQGLLNERYQKGAEMLGNSSVSVRLGGIYALRRLAADYPAQYHIQVIQLFCAFARIPTEDNSIARQFDISGAIDEPAGALRMDVQEVMQAISSLRFAGMSTESDEQHLIYLRDADLCGLQVQDAKLSRAWLTNANLCEAELPRADLSDARLRQANLAGAKLRNANLSRAQLWGANLSQAVLRDADLSGADLCGVSARSDTYAAPVHGLTQHQLDEAHACADDPPKLEGVLDAKTSKQLIWRR